MGKPVDNIMDDLELENYKFGDLIIGDFVDDYFNNTFKVFLNLNFLNSN